jgi:hypothetical protein
MGVPKFMLVISKYSGETEYLSRFHAKLPGLSSSGQFEETRMRVSVTLVEREMLGAIECLEKGDSEKNGGEETNEML